MLAPILPHPYRVSTAPGRCAFSSATNAIRHDKIVFGTRGPTLADLLATAQSAPRSHLAIQNLSGLGPGAFTDVVVVDTTVDVHVYWQQGLDVVDLDAQGTTSSSAFEDGVTAVARTVAAAFER